MQFHGDRLGYVEEMLPNDLVRIREDDGTSRPRRFQERKHLVAVIPKSGVSTTENRTLMQSPEPMTNNTQVIEDNITNEAKELINVLKKTHKWSINKKNITNPLFEYLTLNNHKEKGWIRYALPKDTFDGDIEKRLNKKQRIIYISTYNMLNCFPKTQGDMKGWQNLYYKAWGISKHTSNRIIESYYENGFNPDRKKRSDIGHTLINSTKKRKSVYSPYYVYKREQTHGRYRTHTDRLSDHLLKEELESKAEAEKIVYGNIAKNFVEQGYSIHHNLINALEKTCGNVSYKALANHIGGLATENTISKHLKSLKGFSVVKSRILPQLSKGNKKIRLLFCEAFFIFWYSARYLKSSTKLIMTHMHEKWVHAVVTRSNIKLLESYDIKNRYHYAHHKSFIDQVMFVVINGFIPTDNDILGNGGRSIKVSCVPVGDYEVAKRDSYKRVYDEDGNFSYPHIPENLERRKGNLYWTNKTLCGTRNASEGQFSLINAYENYLKTNRINCNN